jgi:hypothetical protein
MRRDVTHALVFFFAIMIPEWVSWIVYGNLSALIPALRADPHMRTSMRPYTRYQTDITTPLGYAIITDNAPIVKALARLDNVNNVCWCDMDGDDEQEDDLDALALAVRNRVQWQTLDILITYGSPSPDSLRFALYMIVQERADHHKEADPYTKHVERVLRVALEETLQYLDSFYALRWCVYNVK